ncbi:NADP-dependent oxidoreductase [Microvirga sp. 2YAF29]|uniref:NADP-dependent oxidoreductase n=1 Tax=Microvirga sp. 2YAF29 TaxID=3233031 RepID=UPI003F94CEA8
MLENQGWTLARRPMGEPSVEDFSLQSVPLKSRVVEGEVLVRNLLLSLDPYMRWRMNDAKSYARPVEIGQVMVGATVSEVLVSEHPGFKPGDTVLGGGGWQEYSILKGETLQKLTGNVPPSTALGVLGSPGFTAYAGLMKIGMPKPGETVVVGAATGPVGSMVGQLAKLAGCRTVAIAGGPEKCALAKEMFGFDAAIDHRASHLGERLAEACPRGIDVYFENIGGRTLDAVLPLLNDFARVPVCGLVSQYNDDGPYEGETRLASLMRDVLIKRLTMRGFIVTDFAEYRDEFLEMAMPLVASGKITHLEDIVDGLDAAPDAFIGLLQGKNKGKLIVRIA